MSACDGRTDGRTDGQTDGRTDILIVASTGLAATADALYKWRARRKACVRVDDGYSERMLNIVN